MRNQFKKSTKSSVIEPPKKKIDLIAQKNKFMRTHFYDILNKHEQGKKEHEERLRQLKQDEDEKQLALSNLSK